MMKIRSAVFVIGASMVLGACGGGSSGNSADSCVSGIAGLCSSLGATPSPTAATPSSQVQAAAPTVTLTFLNASGTTTNALDGATPITVKATVLDANKKPVPNS